MTSTTNLIAFLALLAFLFAILLIPVTHAFNFHWELDETPEGIESASIVEPVTVILLDEVVQVPSHSASLALMRKYSVHLTPHWTPALAYRLLQTFESIPQEINNPYYADRSISPSVWQLTNRHIQDDITVEFQEDTRLVTIAADAFVNATPLLAEIEGVRGRYFSKRLHRAVVRFVSDNGKDRRALDKILEQRYAVSVNVPDYTELTSHTTQEHAGRFDDFKNEELIAIIAMLEEYPTGMIKTPGLRYLVRRLDGTPHPTHPNAAAVAWTGAGYIEFMEVAFRVASLAEIHRLILHEKAHFLWDYLFDAQLQQDWIRLGGWFENPNDPDGWSTSKQVEFVSAYAHGKNPNEDMAESIAHYIVNPDKLRYRSPAKYQFIQNRIMHGTRYISRIRQDLTFQVYNLYPDRVYPGRVIRVDIEVTGIPENDKLITVEIELHKESELDAATGASTRIRSQKGTTYKDIHLYPVNGSGERIIAGHILRSPPISLSRHAADGYWSADQISITDASGNKRFVGQKDVKWKLYIDNPLADCEPPEYVPNSMRLFLSDARTVFGESYQILHVQWQVIEKNEISSAGVALNDSDKNTYSFSGSGSVYEKTSAGWYVRAELDVPNYYPTGKRYVHTVSMRDVAGNRRKVFFTHYDGALSTGAVKLDEPPATIDIFTPKPDTTPPTLDVNNIKIIAEPTHPENPNGETKVDITFRIKDNFSGYQRSGIYLRDPNGENYNFSHTEHNANKMYFTGDPTVFETYHATILLPIGSMPGTWGLAEMHVRDKARNVLMADFTEIVRFEVSDAPTFAKHDLNGDGNIDILDLVIVSQEIGHAAAGEGIDADLNADGAVNILDLVIIANDF